MFLRIILTAATEYFDIALGNRSMSTLAFQKQCQVVAADIIRSRAAA